MKVSQHSKASLLGSLLVLLLFVIACVEPFEKSFNIIESILVLEGQVSDEAEESFVRLQFSIPSGGRNSFFTKVEGAEVKVIENGNKEIPFQDIGEGLYYPQEDWKGVVGNTYKLIVNTNEGDIYESSEQAILPVSSIDSIYQTTVEDAYIENSVTVASSFIYVDSKDPEEEENFYLWSWRNFELLDACVTCFGGQWFPGPSIEGRCIEQDFLVRRGAILDYECDGFCWDIFSSVLLNIQSDEFLNGLSIKARKVAEIPYYNRIGGLIEVKQQSITKEAFEYLSLLVSQGQETGGLDDVPPAPLTGNIKNVVRDNDVTSGFFLTVGTTKKRHWIDRSNAKQLNLRPLGLLKGRELRFEPPNPDSDPPRPPFAPCLESLTRTGVNPDGFKVELFIDEDGERIRD